VKSQGKTILIVDDEDGMRSLLSHLLTREGYQVKTATQGFDALDVLAKDPSLPALILLDLRMPVMDGWQFRKLQRENSRIAGIPVVVITSAQTTEDDVKSIQAAAYLTKPVQAAMLLKLVREHAAGE
jgi:CheY-like chemotaxis protein